MKNKHLILLFTAFAIASCSTNKKAPEIAPTEVENESGITVTTIFSVPAAEVKKAEKAQVVFFDTNSSKLDDEAIATLTDKVLPEAKNANTKKVVIEAHSDERGSKAYNQRLSEKRAKAVRDYLVKNGVNVKIKTKGYGESKPAARGHNEAAWSKNRRAVTISLKK